MHGTITTLTDDTFHEVVTSSTRPVLVEFRAPGCHPCDLVEPILAAIAAEQRDALEVATVDAHRYPELGRRYDVMATPTIVLFRDGEPVRRVVGARGKGYLLEAFADAVT